HPAGRERKPIGARPPAHSLTLIGYTTTRDAILGYMELDRRGAELLFQLLAEREEKASVAIASNESFGGWTKTFTDPRLCAAIVDRLTFGGNIIETGTDSYRLAHAKNQQSNG
ncbi:ATP-binding protein, partial [Streptomyces sp. NPDC090499]|uniref:ATP-binding protein n=1 Tax=Streptomyces sp. NPDC090499 TaxID=3365965 RepID=UPI00380A53C7